MFNVSHLKGEIYTLSKYYPLGKNNKSHGRNNFLTGNTSIENPIGLSQIPIKIGCFLQEFDSDKLFSCKSLL